MLSSGQKIGSSVSSAVKIGAPEISGAAAPSSHRPCTKFGVSRVNNSVLLEGSNPRLRQTPAFASITKTRKLNPLAEGK